MTRYLGVGEVCELKQVGEIVGERVVDLVLRGGTLRQRSQATQRSSLATQRLHQVAAGLLLLPVRQYTSHYYRLL